MPIKKVWARTAVPSSAVAVRPVAGWRRRKCARYAPAAAAYRTNGSQLMTVKENPESRYEPVGP
jgi:hypothetical protein